MDWTSICQLGQGGALPCDMGKASAHMGGGWLEGRARTMKETFSHLLLSWGKEATGPPTEGMFLIDFMENRLGLRKVKLFLLTFFPIDEV